VEWIRSDLGFGVRQMIAVLTRRDFVELGMAECLRQPDPAVVASRVEQIIVAARPDLQGVVVEAMRQCQLENAWEFSCVHPSFARVADGAAFRRFLLDLNEATVAELRQRWGDLADTPAVVRKEPDR
jgi:hypothetical protein